MNTKAINKTSVSGSRHDGILSGAASLTISVIIVKVLGLIYKIPLAHIMGEEGMGYFNTAYTVYSVFYILCTAGVPKAVMIYLINTDRNDMETRHRIIRVAIRAFLLLGAIVTVAFLLLSQPIADLIGSRESSATMIAVAPSILFIALTGVLRGVMSADMKLSAIACSQIIEGAGKLVIGLLFASWASHNGFSLPMVSAFTMLGVTFGSVFGFIYLYFASGIKISVRKVKNPTDKAEKRSIVRGILRISLPITLSALVMSMTSIVDLGLIMQGLRTHGYSEQEATALYGNYTTLAVPMFNLVIAVITPISAAFLPIFIKSSTMKKHDMLIGSAKSSLELTALLCAPLVIGTYIFSKEILTLIFGNDGVEIGSMLLRALIPSAVFMSLLLIVNSLLEARGAVNVPVISMLIGGAVKSVVTYVLLCNSDFEIIGAPIGTLISYGVALSVSLLVLSVRHPLPLPIISTQILPYINAFASIWVARVIYSHFLFSLGGAFGTLSAIAVSAVLYSFLSFVMGLLSKDKLMSIAKYTKEKEHI